MIFQHINSRLQIAFTFAILFLTSFLGFSQNVQLDSALRLVNEKSCMGYTSSITFPTGKVSSYLKKELNEYGKNEGKRKTYVYRNSKVVGMNELVTIYSQLEKTSKENCELWLGILTDDGESHLESKGILYDIILNIYLNEADKAIESAQRDYDKSLDKGFSLSAKLQHNINGKKKIESELNKNEHELNKIQRHLVRVRERNDRLKTALNEAITNTTNADAIEKAQKHYDKVAKDLGDLEKKFSKVTSNKAKLEEGLIKNEKEKQELELGISSNLEEQVQLKEVLEKLKQSRSEIR
ncbi:MAG: hypothetical protein ACJAWV_002440 [Flammeovirgaceae bacterium]|jgi:hypothetical protein